MRSKVLHLKVLASIYKNALDHFPLPTVDVLFFTKDMSKTLLFKRTNKPLKGTYFSAGGRMAKNETILQTAVRKAKEETGLSIDKKKLFFGGVQDEIYTTSIFPNVGYHAVDTYFGYVLGAEKIVLDTQHSTMKWFDVTDPKLHPHIKNKIKHLLAAYDKTH